MFNLKTIKSIPHHKYVEYISILYAFSMPLSRVAISLFSVILILLWFTQKDLKLAFQTVIKNKVLSTFLIFVIYTMLTLLWTESENVKAAFGAFVRFWYVLPMFAFFSLLSKEAVPKVLLAFLLGMLISEIVSFGIFFELWTYKDATPISPTPFMNHIIYSVFLAITSLIVLNKFFSISDLKLKILYASYFILVTSNLFVNGGRTGQLSFIVGLFFLGMSRIQHKLIALFVMLFLSVSILFIAYNTSHVFKLRVDAGMHDIQQMQANNYNTSWGMRILLLDGGIDLVKDAPVFGYGKVDAMDKFEILQNTTRPELKYPIRLSHFHNQYLQILLQSGIIGLIIFFTLFYQIYKLKIEHSELRYIKTIFLSVFLVAFIPEVILGRQFTLALFGFMIAILLVLSRKEVSKSI